MARDWNTLSSGQADQLNSTSSLVVGSSTFILAFGLPDPDDLADDEELDSVHEATERGEERLRSSKQESQAESASMSEDDEEGEASGAVSNDDMFYDHIALPHGGTLVSFLMLC